MSEKGMFRKYIELESKSVKNCYNTPYYTTGIKLELMNRAYSGKIIDNEQLKSEIISLLGDPFFLDRELFNL